MLEDPFSIKEFIALISMNNVRFQLILSSYFLLSFSFLINLLILGWSLEIDWSEEGEIISSF